MRGRPADGRAGQPLIRALSFGVPAVAGRFLLSPRRDALSNGGGRGGREKLHGKAIRDESGRGGKVFQEGTV